MANDDYSTVNDEVNERCGNAFAEHPRAPEPINDDPLAIIEYVEKFLPLFNSCLFDKPEDSGLTDYHLDKTIQYHGEWALAGCDLRRASLIYLLTYTRYLKEEKSTSAQWVIRNYDLFSWVLRKLEVEAGTLVDNDYKLKRVVVTAANKMITPDGNVLLLVGARHWSMAMHAQWRLIKDAVKATATPEEYTVMREGEDQGFIDQWDQYMTRREAYVVARMAGQLNVRRAKSGNPLEPVLWSEDIH